MIARFIFAGILVFFMSLPAHADTDRFSRVLELLDGALKCQAALSLTSNYNLIYRALNRGLEKVNPPESITFKNKLDVQWKLIELIVKLNSNMDFNKVEKRLFTEATNYLTTSIRTLKVSDEHIVNLMKLNSSCATRAPLILNLLIDEFPEDNPTADP